MSLFLRLHRFFTRPASWPLNSHDPIITLPVLLTHSDYQLHTTFALDTGASYTVISPFIATHLKLKLNRSTQITTATGIETAALTKIPVLSVLGRTHSNSPALVADIPEESGVTGLLGLSLLQHFHLELDFPHSQLFLR